MMKTRTVTLTEAHMDLLWEIALKPGLETGNRKMRLEKKRLIPGLYACNLIRFGKACANITRVTVTPDGVKALRKKALTFELPAETGE